MQKRCIRNLVLNKRYWAQVSCPTLNKTQWNNVRSPLLLMVQQAGSKWILIWLQIYLYSNSNVQQHMYYPSSRNWELVGSFGPAPALSWRRATGVIWEISYCAFGNRDIWFSSWQESWEGLFLFLTSGFAVFICLWLLVLTNSNNSRLLIFFS